MSAQQPASTAPVLPQYRLPRYEEDWSLWRDGCCDDFGDPIKNIPVGGKEGYYVSLGGELRETYERFHNPDFGASPQDPDGYVLERLLGHGDLHLASHIRLFGELVSALEFGRKRGPRPVIDENRLDVSQAFVDCIEPVWTPVRPFVPKIEEMRHYEVISNQTSS